MTVSSTENKSSFLGNGRSKRFPFPYRFLLQTDLTVLQTDDEGIETELVLDTDYTVTGEGGANGGEVSLLVAPPTGSTLVILNEPEITQPLALQKNRPFPAEDYETALDRMNLILQRAGGWLSRAMRLSDAYAAPFDTRLPNVLGAGKIFRVNDAGNGFVMAGSLSDVENAAANASAAAASRSEALVSQNNAAQSALAQVAANVVPFKDIVFLTAADSPYNVTPAVQGFLIIVDASAGPVSIVMPLISGLTGMFTSVIKKADTSSNAVTITPTGADTVASGASKTIVVPNAAAILMADTGNWFDLDIALLKDGSVTTAKFADLSVTVPKFADGAITPAKLAAAVEVSFLPRNDFGGDADIKSTPQFLFGSHTKIAPPAVQPSGPFSVDWAPNGEFIAFADSASPFIHIYARQGIAFDKLPNPGSLPSNTTHIMRWSPNGEFLAMGTLIANYIYIYQRVGRTFTLCTIGTAPVGFIRRLCWSPNSQYLVALDTVSPTIIFYKRTGTTFTKLADPVAFPTSASSCDFSPDGKYVALGGSGLGNRLWLYERNGDTFTLQAYPATPPTVDTRALAWHPTGKYLAVFGSGASQLLMYSVLNGVLTPVAVTFSGGNTGTNGLALSWSPNGKYLAVSHGSASLVQVYAWDEPTLTFTRLAASVNNPPSACNDVSWSLDSQFLAVAVSGGEQFYVYQTGLDFPAADERAILVVRKIRNAGA